MELLNRAHGSVITHEIVQDTDGEIVRAELSGGHVYKGPITMNGSAHYQWNDGTSYDGDFQNGEITGFGVYDFKDCTYSGHVSCGLRHGYGTLVIHDTNTKYIGEWSNGKREGKGTCLYKNGDEYTGQWRNDCKNGYGIMRWNSLNEIYCGQWRDDKPHGIGIHVMCACASNDDATIDSITTEQLEGLHNFSCFNGLNWYRGQWKDGKRDGFGIYNYSNGAQYKGQWVQNKKHGKAEYIYENAALFIGEFVNDQQKEYSERMEIQISKPFVIHLDDSTMNKGSDTERMYKIMLRHWKSLQNIFPSLCTLSKLWILIDMMKLKRSQTIYDLNKYIASYTVYPNHICDISNPNHRFLFREFNEILIKLSTLSENNFEECVQNVIQLSPQIAKLSLVKSFWEQLSTPYKELWIREECKSLFEQRYEATVNHLSTTENINENTSATYVSGNVLKEILQNVIKEPVVQSIVMKEFENCYGSNATAQPLIVQPYDIEMNLDSMRFLPHECILFFVLLISINVAYDEMLSEKEKERVKQEEERKLEMEAQANQKGKKSKTEKRQKIEEDPDCDTMEEERPQSPAEQLKLIQIIQTHIDSAYDQIKFVFFNSLTK